MSQTAATLLAAAALACAASAAEKKVQMKDLPPAVQKTVQEQTRGAEIKGLSKETEKGVTSYEVETVANGKHRDMQVNAAAVTEVEEETPIEGIPAAARAAIEKKAAGGKIDLVETITKGSEVLYEAAYTDRKGKKREVLVKADGVETKD